MLSAGNVIALLLASAWVVGLYLLWRRSAKDKRHSRRRLGLIRSACEAREAKETERSAAVEAAEKEASSA